MNEGCIMPCSLHWAIKTKGKGKVWIGVELYGVDADVHT